MSRPALPSLAPKTAALLRARILYYEKQRDHEYPPEVENMIRIAVSELSRVKRSLKAESKELLR
jgi:hypothetical protein